MPRVCHGAVTASWPKLERTVYVVTHSVQHCKYWASVRDIKSNENQIIFYLWMANTHIKQWCWNMEINIQ